MVMAVKIKFINEDGRNSLKGLNNLLKKLFNQVTLKAGIYEFQVIKVKQNLKQEKKLFNLSTEKPDNVKIPLKGKIYFVDMKKPQWYDLQEWDRKITFAIKRFNEQKRKTSDFISFYDYLFNLCIKLNGREFKPCEVITDKDIKQMNYKNKESLYASFFRSRYLVKINDFPGYFDWSEDFLDEVRKIKPDLGLENNKTFQKKEDKMSINVEIAVGKHSVKIPKGMKELLTELLKAAKVKPGTYKVRLGKFLKGSSHQQGKKGLKIKKYVDTGVYVIAQPGSNDTACEIIMLSPNGKNIRDWFSKLKLGAKRLKKHNPQLKKREAFHNFMKKLCLRVNAQIFRPSQVVTAKDAKECSYKHKASLVATIFNAKSYVLRIPNNPGHFSWNENFVQELKSCVQPDLGFEEKESKKKKPVHEKIAVNELENKISNLQDTMNKDKKQKELLQKNIDDLLESQKYLKVEIFKLQEILNKKIAKEKNAQKKIKKINQKLKKDKVDFDQLQIQLKKRDKELQISKLLNELVIETGSKEKAIDKLLDLLDQ